MKWGVSMGLHALLKRIFGYDDEKREKSTLSSLNAEVVNQSTEVATKRADQYFQKNATYNRDAYVDTAAMRNAKETAFKDSTMIKDPYSRNLLYRDQASAKAKYGDNWQKHVSETDHTVPVHDVYENHKNDAFTTNQDIRETANDPHNFQQTSREFNNAKRDRTNRDFVNDSNYLHDKKIHLSEKGKNIARERGGNAADYVEGELQYRSVKNAGKLWHETGMTTAGKAGKYSLALSGIQNLTEVISGKKKASEAFKNTASDTAKAVAIGYASGGIPVVNRFLTSSSSPLIKQLGRANVPGKIITAVMTTGNILNQFAEGRISANECVTEVSEAGIGLYMMDSYMGAGQILIPIPYVGAAVGALVGSAMTGFLLKELNEDRAQIEKNNQIKAVCDEIATQQIAYRKEFERYASQYLNNCQREFDSVFYDLNKAWWAGDAEGVVSAANQGIRHLCGQPCFETKDDFDQFMHSDEAFKL